MVVATTASCVCPVVESALWCACMSHMQCSMKIGLILGTSGKIAGPFAQMATVNRCAMKRKHKAAAGVATEAQWKVLSKAGIGG